MPQWVTPAATLLASFAGAFIAFGLHWWADHAQRRRANVASANRVLMTLLLHARVLANYKDVTVGDYEKKDPYRSLKVEASLNYDLARFRYDYGSLDFLGEVSEHQVILDLFEEEDLFTETLRAINDRSALVYNEVDPALFDAGLADGEEREGSELVKALGVQLFGAFERKTDSVVDGLGETLAKINQVICTFREAAVTRYSNKEIMDINVGVGTSAPNMSMQRTRYPRR